MDINDVYSLFNHLLWNEKFWLPENVRWEDLENVNQSKISDLWYCVPATICILIIRHIFKNTISVPFGKIVGLKDKSTKKIQHNPILEKEYQLFGKDLATNHGRIKELAKMGVGTEREIERWLRKRMSHENYSKLTKFGECHWKLMWYSSSSVAALCIFWDQPWFWNNEERWANFPLQVVGTDLKWYYIINASYALALTVIQFRLPYKTKDHWQLVIHHFATVFLLVMSYASTIIRFGALILLTHDIGDIFLNLCKLCGYAKNNTLQLLSFFLFTIVWIVTRLMIFPFIIYSGVFTIKFNMFPAMAICIGMLITLQFLHIIWTYYIYKILVRTTQSGKFKDARSSSEESSG